jgi:RNA polymerase sigma-70 factor, ECF subfamily
MAQMASRTIDQPIAGAIPASHNRTRHVMGEHGEGAGMGPHDSFPEVEGKLREGDQDAATKVFRLFATKLIGLARTKLDIRIRRKEDPDDVVQSVFRSFFTRHRDGEYDLATWDSLWSLLTVITVRKCQSRAKHYGTKRRDVKREVDGAPQEGAAAGQREPISPESSPFENCVATETEERMMRGLKPEEREIIELFRQGHTSPEISARLGRAERTVRRVVEGFRRSRGTEYGPPQHHDAAGEVQAKPGDGAAAGLSEAIGREPTPLEANVLAETVEQMMRGLEPGDRAIIELLLQGCTAQEISARVALSETTVLRLRKRITERLQHMRAEETDAA